MSGIIPDELEPVVRQVLESWVAQHGVDGAWKMLVGFCGGDTKLAQRVVEEVFKSTLPIPQAPQQPIPADPDGEWTAQLNRQMCFMDYPAYYGLLMPRQSVSAWLTMIRDAGLTGPEIELSGPDPVEEYIEKRPTQNFDLEGWYDRAEDEMAFVMSIVRSLGLIVNLKFCQANWSQPEKKSTDWWRERAKRFAVRVGTENIICLALNETDTRVSEDYRYAIERGLLDGGFQRWQLIGYGSKRDLGFSETHPRSFDHIKSGDHTRLQIPDNGDMIEILYGKNWRQGGVPSVGNIQKYIRMCKQAGTSTGMYSFDRQPNPVALQATSAGWRAA